MKMTRWILLGGLVGLLASATHAADVAGQWWAEFDTQIGVQKYTFTFRTDGDKLSGKAVSEAGERKREAELKEGTITGDTLSFVELLNFQGNDLRIRYTGKAGANEIAFTREVGEFAKESFKATRVAVGGGNAPAVESANKAQAAVPQEPRIPRNRSITLGPDDRAAFDEPPTGIAAKREGIPHGKL